MKSKIIKPDLNLYFASMREIGSQIQGEYDIADTFEDIANLFHRWTSIAENTLDEAVKYWYTAAANYIYSFFTGRSFECKKFETI